MLDLQYMKKKQLMRRNYENFEKTVGYVSGS